MHKGRYIIWNDKIKNDRVSQLGRFVKNKSKLKILITMKNNAKVDVYFECTKYRA